MGKPVPDDRNLHPTWIILIIDDDEDEFLIAKEMLKEARGGKFEVHWASTYAAGREELFSNPYHAVLVDYDLGAQTGIELIREANQQGCAAPLILFTGRGSYEVDVEAMQVGATMYLTKGEVNPLLLERSIRYAVERKRAEETIAASHQRTAEILESINDGFFELDHEWRFTYLNQRAASNVRKTAAALVGKNIWESFPAVLGTPLEQIYRQVMEQRQPAYFEMPGVLTNQWYDIRVYPSTAGISIFWVDISEKKRVQEALKISEEKFAKAFHSSPVAMAITTLTGGRYMEVNDSYSSLFGFCREELIGHTSIELGIFTSAEERQEIAQLVQAGQRIHHRQIRFRAKTGDLLDVSFSTEPLEIDGQRCLLSLNIDISEQRRAEAQILQLNQEILQRNAELENERARCRESETRLQEILRNTRPGAG